MKILIQVNVVAERVKTFMPELWKILKLQDPELFVKVNIINVSYKQIQGFAWNEDTLNINYFEEYTNLEWSINSGEKIPYDKITNRQGRIGMINSYRFNEKFDAFFLMDDDMEIFDPILFEQSIKSMCSELLVFNLAFIKTTTRPDNNKSAFQNNIGWPWMASGIMLRADYYDCPNNLIDEWFFLDDFILMKRATEYYEPRFKQYNWNVGLIHHTSTDASEKGIIVPKVTCDYLSDGLYPEAQEFNQDFIKRYSEYFNSLNSI